MRMLYPYPRLHRLLKPKDFQQVFKNPLKITASFFIFFIQKNELPYSRLGLVITKRRFKHAVQRNRMRRLIRESFRTCSAQIGNIDVIVLAKDKAQSQINTILLGELNQQWQKLILAPSPKYVSLK